MDHPRAPGLGRWMLLILGVPILGQVIMLLAGAARADATLSLIAIELLAGFAVALLCSMPAQYQAVV